LRAFLCHSSSDKEAVRSLYRQLRGDGVLPWLDEENLLPGQDWRREISVAIRRSDVVLVCLSEDSVTRTGYVQREIREALDIADQQPEGAIFIIPLRLESCQVPDRLGRWHWVDLFEKRGYERLLNSLRSRAEDVNANIRPDTLAEPAALTVVDRARRLLATTANRSNRLALLALYREYPTDYGLFHVTLPDWSDAFITAVAEEAPDDLGAVLGALDRHLPRTFPFSSLDNVASVLGRAYRITDDSAVREAALRSLLRIGARYDETDMGKEFAAFVGRARSPQALRPFATALKENWDAAVWAKGHLKGAGAWERVAEALFEVGIYFADLGDPSSEAAFQLRGWGSTEEIPAVPRAPSGDRTLRCQALLGDSSISFAGLPCGDYLLTAEVLGRRCDDSFQILIGEEVRYDYQHTSGNKLSFGPHVVDIPAELLASDVHTVTFRNTATDECGFAGVYNAKVERHLARSAVDALPLEALTIPASGGEERAKTIAPVIDKSWQAANRRTALAGLAGVGLKGSMEAVVAVEPKGNWSQQDLRRAVDAATIPTFGWPIGISLEHDEARPRPTSNGIVAGVAIVTGQSNLDRPSYDYWNAQRSGDCYVLWSLFEDSRGRREELFFNTRIVQATELLLFLAGLYGRQLNMADATAVRVELTHGGLVGRRLSAVGSRTLRTRGACMEETAESELLTTVGELNLRLVDNVKALLAPMFVLFDFAEIADSVWTDIVERFIAGEIS
jgi:hypothetical protein